MIRKIQKVELQASANAIVRGEVVTLTANLSDLELENIRERNGRLEYRVGDSLADADSVLTEAIERAPAGSPLEARARVEQQLVRLQAGTGTASD